MKCQECGYVSFDDLADCKKCGAALASSDPGGGDSEPSRLQAELFSTNLDESESSSGEGDGSEEEMDEEPGSRGSERAGTGIDETEVSIEHPMEAPAELPDMRIDYDPAEDEGAGPADSEEEEAGVHRREFDDESALPEEMWIEEGAGFLPRLAAFGLDCAILAAILSLFLGAAAVALSVAGHDWEGGGVLENFPLLLTPFYFLGLFASLAYFTFFLGWIGKTPGKALLKLDVRRTDGGPMTYTRAFLRWSGYLVSITFAGLGFLWIFFDQRKRGWHDFLSGTWVKDLRHEE